MRLNYFCPHHTHLIQQCEAASTQWWNQLMKRGLAAYSSCRIDAADIFLKSALSVALLRYKQPRNTWLKCKHITKPAEVLLELHLHQHQYSDAIELLSEISTATWSYPSEFENELSEFLALQYERVEMEEKDYTCNRGGMPPATQSSTVTKFVRLH